MHRRGWSLLRAAVTRIRLSRLHSSRGGGSDSLKQNIALCVKQFHGQPSGSALDNDLVVKGTGKGIHSAKFCATRDVGKFVNSVVENA